MNASGYVEFAKNRPWYLVIDGLGLILLVEAKRCVVQENGDE
jgi:hypothetical protein